MFKTAREAVQDRHGLWALFLRPRDAKRLMHHVVGVAGAWRARARVRACVRGLANGASRELPRAS